MDYNELVYKLYKDTSVKPTKDLYIKPLLIGTGFATGMIGSCFVFGDNLVLRSIATGITTLFVVKGLINIPKYKRQKENYQLQLERLEIFKEEAIKIIGKDINIDTSDVVSAFEVVSQDINTINIIYEDNSQLVETVEESSKCFYYDKNEDKKIDITSAKDIAYSIKK